MGLAQCGTQSYAAWQVSRQFIDGVHLDLLGGQQPRYRLSRSYPHCYYERLALMSRPLMAKHLSLPLPCSRPQYPRHEATLTTHAMKPASHPQYPRKAVI